MEWFIRMWSGPSCVPEGALATNEEISVGSKHYILSLEYLDARAHSPSQRNTKKMIKVSIYVTLSYRCEGR